MSTRAIPSGWVRRHDGSYSPPSAVGRIVATPIAAGQESRLHAAIAEHCASLGWLTVHSAMHQATTTAKGVPDFIIALPGGMTLWVECKTAVGKPTPEQLGWGHRLSLLGHRWSIVRSMGEFLALVENAKS